MNFLPRAHRLRRHPVVLEDSYEVKSCESLVGMLAVAKDSRFVKYKRISHSQSLFNSYEFDFSGADKSISLFENAFNYLLKCYVKNGFVCPWDSVSECHGSGETGHGAYLNPLVFEYLIPSEFGWHAHSARYQKFQLVMNLTSPGRDYESAVFEVAFNASTSWKLTKHPQGSVFSFPYPYAHRVTRIKPVSDPCVIQRYVHLLMPIHPRGGFSGAFIPLQQWPQELLPNTKLDASFV